MNLLDYMTIDITKSYLRKRVIDYARSEEDANELLLKRIRIENETVLEFIEDITTSMEVDEAKETYKRINKYLSKVFFFELCQHQTSSENLAYHFRL